MNPTLDRATALGLLSARPSVTGLFCDFDGTLSPIVDRPQDASALPAAAEVLADLARSLAVVAVISGRSVDDLRSRLHPDGVVLAGSYGRERSDRPMGARRRDWDAVASAALRALGDTEGVVVERKEAGVALHYRLAPGCASDVEREARALAESYGLRLRPGRMVVELTEPGPGKADALRRFVEEHDLEAFAFCGDDVADAEAFEWARSSGRACVLVAVRSAEAPPQIEALADLVTDGPAGVVSLLDDLRRRLRPPG